MNKLKILNKDKIRYVVPLPERLDYLKESLEESQIIIKFIDGEYQYIPRKFTFAADVRFTSDELQLIVDELKRLNN